MSFAEHSDYFRTKTGDDSGKYEVGVAWVGNIVDVIDDPADVSELTIEVAHHAPWTARPLEIGEYAGQRPPLPDHLGETPADGSRVLAAAAKQRAARHPGSPPAISFRGLSSPEEAGHDV
jgi:putative transposase